MKAKRPFIIANVGIQRLTTIINNQKPLFIATTVILIAAVAVGFFTYAPKEEAMIYAFDQLYVATDQDVTAQVNAAGLPEDIGHIIYTSGEYRPFGGYGVWRSTIQANFDAPNAPVIKYDSGIAVNIDGRWLEFAPATYRISYQDEISQIVADIPIDWTYELITPETNYDADLLTHDKGMSPDVGLRVFVDGQQDETIEVLRLQEPGQAPDTRGVRDIDFNYTHVNHDFLAARETHSSPDHHALHVKMSKRTFESNAFQIYSIKAGATIIDSGYLSHTALIKDISENSVTVDPIELITHYDTDRIAELGLTEQDMIPGYYIHNPEADIVTWPLSTDAAYTFFDWHTEYVRGNFRQFTTTDNATFRAYLQDCDQEPAMPFLFILHNDQVSAIQEKWLF